MCNLALYITYNLYTRTYIFLCLDCFSMCYVLMLVLFLVFLNICYVLFYSV